MGTSIEQTHSARLLGISIDKNLVFDSHVSELCKKVATQLAVLTRFKRILDIPSKLAIVKTFIMSHFKYCSIIYHFCSCENSQKMDRIIERALRYVYSDFDSTYNDLLEKSDLASLENDRQKDIVIQTFKILHGIAPGYLNKFIGRRNIGYGTRQLYDLCLPRYNKVKHGKKSIHFLMPYLWNDLPRRIKAIPELDESKQEIKEWKGKICRCGLCRYQETLTS